MHQPSTAVQYGFEKTTAFLVHQNLPWGEAGKRQAMSCEVVFGSPSANCSGTGICKITARHTPRPADQPIQRDCQSTLGVFTAAQDGQGLSLLLFREFLCVKILRNHLLSGVLQVKEPCRLPSGLAAFLHLKSPAIPAGRYPIEECNGNYHIRFGHIQP